MKLMATHLDMHAADVYTSIPFINKYFLIEAEGKEKRKILKKSLKEIKMKKREIKMKKKEKKKKINYDKERRTFFDL